MKVLDEKGGVGVTVHFHFSLRDLRILDRCEGLHLCEQDSTVWNLDPFSSIGV